MRTALFANRTVIAGILSAFFALSLNAAPLAVGDELPQLTGVDQHDAAYAIDKGTRFVLVSYDMSPGKQANNFLDEKGATYLPEHKAVYVANIHGMPGFVASTFALPKMRKYAHRIMIMNTEGAFDNWPQEKGKVAVFALDAEGKITSITQWSPKGGDAPF